jgi:hypothetical protein
VLKEKLNIESGILIDLRLLLLSMVVLKIFTLNLEAEFFTWELLLEPL